MPGYGGCPGVVCRAEQVCRGGAGGGGAGVPGSGRCWAERVCRAEAGAGGAGVPGGAGGGAGVPGGAGGRGGCAGRRPVPGGVGVLGGGRCWAGLVAGAEPVAAGRVGPVGGLVGLGKRWVGRIAYGEGFDVVRGASGCRKGK
ncbi:hypothetical protein GCM10010168_32890 [Actinoplanes ianthinogenes]|nr:hypothetical protein GCM10010168_32890 [Actinoplanes ianthinogenes]